MGIAGPILVRKRSPYDAVVRRLALSQPQGADPEWADWKRHLTALVRRGRDFGWLNKIDAFPWYAMPELSGGSIKVDLRNPAATQTVSVGALDSESLAGARFADGGRIDSGLAFSGAAHTLLTFYNSNDEDDFTTAVSGARHGGATPAQVMFNPRTALNRMQFRDGPVQTISVPSVSSLGLCGIARVDASNVRICSGGFAIDMEHESGGLLPTGNVFFGQINDSTEGSQTHRRVCDILCRSVALTAAEMADIHSAIVDFLEEVEELETYVDPVALGESWFRRDHIDEVTPAGSVLMVGPTGPPLSDNQSNIASYYGEGYSRFPQTHVQVRVTPDRAAEWQQTESGVLIRNWEPRLSLPNRKPNGVDGMPRVNGKAFAVDYDSFEWAELAGFAGVMSLSGETPEYIMGVLEGLGLPVGDDYNDPDGVVFTTAYAATIAEDLVEYVRLGKAVAFNKIFLPEGVMTDVPNGKCTIIRPDFEVRDFRSPSRLQMQMERYDDYCGSKGIMFAPGFNSMLSAASSGCDPSVMPQILALPNLWSSNITMVKRPPNGDVAAALDAELAFYGASPPRKLLCSWAVNPFALQDEVGEEYCRALNEWMNDHDDVMLGYSETPGAAVFGGDYTTKVNTCRARAYGIYIPTDPEYPGDPEPPVTHTRDYDFRFGSLPPGITVDRADVRYAFDADGTLTAFAADTGRFDYLYGSVPRGLVIEQGTTNIFTYSDQFNNAFWSVNARCQLLDVDGDADPLGGTTADKLEVGTTANGSHNIVVTGAITHGASKWFSISVIMKPVELLYGVHALAPAGTNNRGNYDLVNATAQTTIGTGLSSARRTSADHVLTGLTASSGAGATSSPNFGIHNAYTGNSYVGVVGDGCWIWGAQHTETDCILLPILTAGSAVTVAADDVDSSSAEALTDSTFYVESYAAQGHGWKKQTIWSRSADADNKCEVYRDIDKSIHVVSVVAGVTTSDLNLGTVEDGAKFCVAARQETNDFAAILGGGSIQTDASGAVPSSLTEARLGRDASGANYFNGAVSRLQHRASKTNAELIAAVTDYTGFEVEE